jgi:hypothetical protein
MKNLFISILLLQSLVSNSQTRCKGLLIDSISNQPIEFANIGIVGKGIGTVTNEKGEYDFIVPDSLIKEKIRVSIIGYKTRSYQSKSFSLLNRILLTQEATHLNEVAVAAKKSKTKLLGNEATGSGVSVGFNKNNLGAEMAIKLNIKHPKTHIKKFMIKINSCGTEKAMFRFNVYNLDSKGYPKDNILKQNIIIEPSEKTGLITFDLMPYEIFVDEDVFIAIEWIKDLGDAKSLMFASKLVGNATYFRQASQDKWEKVSPIGVGLHAEVAY